MINFLNAAIVFFSLQVTYIIYNDYNKAFGSFPTGSTF